MDQQSLSANLRKFRANLGLTQAQLADKAGLSRIGYRNVEIGTADPRLDTLSKIARALGMNTDALLASRPSLTAVRFRASKKLSSRSEVITSVAEWLESFNDLESQLGERKATGLNSFEHELAPFTGVERAIKAAQLARQKMGINPDEPIRDLCGTLDKYGIKLYTPKVSTEGFFGLSVAESDGGPLIVVNTWERLSVERWIFTAAHELGHILLHFDSYDISKTDEDPVEEAEANAFASEFLMPAASFTEQLNEAMGLPLITLVFKLKRFFGVSWKSVLYRISLTHPSGPSIWGRFQAECRRKFGRTISATEEHEGMPASAFGHPKRVDELDHLSDEGFIPERLYRLVRLGIEKNIINNEAGAALLDIDIESIAHMRESWIATI